MMKDSNKGRHGRFQLPPKTSIGIEVTTSIILTWTINLSSLTSNGWRPWLLSPPDIPCLHSSVMASEESCLPSATSPHYCLDFPKCLTMLQTQWPNECRWFIIIGFRKTGSDGIPITECSFRSGRRLMANHECCHCCYVLIIINVKC